LPQIHRLFAKNSYLVALPFRAGKKGREKGFSPEELVVGDNTKNGSIQLSLMISHSPRNLTAF
jgi:hypothetical protein